VFAGKKSLVSTPVLRQVATTTHRNLTFTAPFIFEIILAKFFLVKSAWHKILPVFSAGFCGF